MNMEFINSLINVLVSNSFLTKNPFDTSIFIHKASIVFFYALAIHLISFVCIFEP